VPRLAGILLALSVAACGGKATASGPAWPKSAGWETPEDWKEDGGQSIDPESSEVAAVESSDEPGAGADGEAVTTVEPEAPPADAPIPDPETPEIEIVPEEAIIIEGEMPEEPPAEEPPAEEPPPPDAPPP